MNDFAKDEVTMKAYTELRQFIPGICIDKPYTNLKGGAVSRDR